MSTLLAGADAGAAGVCFSVVAFGGIAVLAVVWTASRSRDVLDQWAAANGFTIVNRERRQLRTGPYVFRRVKGQEVFYVTVEDAGGRRRSGYVRVGGFALGLLSNAADVTWDDDR